MYAPVYATTLFKPRPDEHQAKLLASEGSNSGLFRLMVAIREDDLRIQMVIIGTSNRSAVPTSTSEPILISTQV